MWKKCGLVLLLSFSLFAAPPAKIEKIDEGITRYFPNQETLLDGAFSFIYIQETEGTPLASPPSDVVPTFGQGRILLPLPSEISLYGTGEVAGPLLRNGQVTRLWNTDVGKYDRSNSALYQSHPWVLAVRPDGTSFGLLAETTWRGRIDLSRGIEIEHQGPPCSVVIIEGDTPQEVLTRLSKLIGTAPLPPLWALGYHQCRFSYKTHDEALTVAQQFREKKIPCDVLWLDIDYMDGYRIFTFNPNRYPNPRETNNKLHQLGLKSIWMIDPGVKVDPGYFVYDQGTNGDHWIQNAHGVPYEGRVWPGACVFPDFTRPPTRTWWAGLYHDFLATGIDGVWNDMNEPAVFSEAKKTIPDSYLYRGGNDLSPALQPKYHNIYGFLMSMATREGIARANPHKRPFVLSRASFLGGARFAATWTGDNSATWAHLEDSIPMVLNLGLSGQPFSGPDIGGFFGDGNDQMFAYWMGTGALLPFARGHTDRQSRRKEPWTFGPEVEEICRTALQRRYRLLPYLYTLFYEASKTGLPVARPTFFADLKDPALRSEDRSFLLGKDLLVRSHRTSLLEGWRPVSLIGPEEKKGAHPSLFLRPGAILPVGPIVQSTNEYKLDPLTLIIALDDEGKAEGLLYEDEGDGFGDFLLTRFKARKVGEQIQIELIDEEGELPRPDRPILIELLSKTESPAPIG